MKRFELPIYLALLVLLSGLLISEGRIAARLSGAQSLSAKELYATLAHPQLAVQVIDLRRYDDDQYLDEHVPGAIPMPACDLEQAPAGAADRIFSYAPTILITDSGDLSSFEKCRMKFSLARNLAGGMAAWTKANLPVDSGDYSPPKFGAGGGCL
jgi:rhodanese-related sulfurtransferase